MTADTIPYVKTLPANLNMPVPMPWIHPSLFPSSALEVNELAKPQMGTNSPAPHFWSILS